MATKFYLCYEYWSMIRKELFCISFVNPFNHFYKAYDKFLKKISFKKIVMMYVLFVWSRTNKHCPKLFRDFLKRGFVKYENVKTWKRAIK